MWAWAFTALESLHALHLLHAVCSGVDDVLVHAGALLQAPGTWHVLHDHGADADAGASLANATTLTTAVLAHHGWGQSDGTVGLQLLPEQRSVAAAHGNCSAAATYACSAPAGVDEKDGNQLVGGWLFEAGSHKPADRGSLGHQVVLAQLGTVVLFEALMSVNGGAVRGAAAKTWLVLILAGAHRSLTHLSHTRPLSARTSHLTHLPLFLSGVACAHVLLPDDSGADLSQWLSSAENLCLPLHLTLQILQTTARGRERCKEHLKRTGRRRRCSGDSRRRRSGMRTSSTISNTGASGELIAEIESGAGAAVESPARSPAGSPVGSPVWEPPAEPRSFISSPPKPPLSNL